MGNLDGLLLIIPHYVPVVAGGAQEEYQLVYSPENGGLPIRILEIHISGLLIKLIFY